MYNAIYTMSLEEALKTDPTILDGIELNTDAQTKQLRDEVLAQYFNWEIAGETLQEFKSFIKYKFKEYAEYYQKLIDVYDQEIDYAKGEYEYREDTISGNSDYSYTPGVKTTVTNTPATKTEQTFIDLPRSTASEERATSKTVNEDSGTNTSVTEYDGGSNDSERNYQSSIVSEKNRGNAVDLRDNYRKKLHDIYHDFADRFKPCFIELWS